MLHTATNHTTTKSRRSPFGWLILSTGLLFISQIAFAQTAPIGSRNATLVKIASRQIDEADSTARVTHQKPDMIRIDKIDPVLPHSALFIITAAEGTVTELPTLASGGGMASLVETIENQITNTQITKDKSFVETSVYATLTIRADGTVQQAKIVEGQNATINAAVLAAIQRLPRLTPGQVAGTAVPVRLTIPVQVKS